jgi:hypothetical protein
MGRPPGGQSLSEVSVRTAVKWHCNSIDSPDDNECFPDNGVSMDYWSVIGEMKLSFLIKLL